MSDIFPAGPSFRVTTGSNGKILAYGNTSDENPSGAFSLMFVPTEDFAGSFAVVGRVPGISTADASVPWVAFPYRRVSIDNVASDYAIVSAIVSGTTTIHVPANGWAVGLLAECTAGQCMIYSRHMEGAAAP